MDGSMASSDTGHHRLGHRGRGHTIVINAHPCARVGCGAGGGVRAGSGCALGPEVCEVRTADWREAEAQCLGSGTGDGDGLIVQ